MTNQPLLKQGMNPRNTTPAQQEAIKTLQKFINVKVDGDFGPATAAAVKVYQKAHNLTADGIVGNNTWATIPSNPITQPATPLQAKVATVNAAKTAAATIVKQVAPKPATPAPAPPRPTIVPQVVTQAAVAAKAAVAQTAKTATIQVQKVHDAVQIAVKKQPVWVRIVGFAGLAIAGIAGFKHFSETPRRRA